MEVRKLREGFTLIELLIVIVIIGILATAVLSAINPVEQIRKASDSGKKSDAAELLNALERYYTTFQQYPWDADSNCAAPDGSAAIGTGGNCWTARLVAVDEVKSEFEDRSTLASLYVSVDTTSKLVHVCFDPESSTFEELVAANPKDSSGNSSTGGTYMCLPE